MMDVREHNREAWDQEVARGNRWTQPVDADVMAAARRGDWVVLLTENEPVPLDWFPSLLDCDALCLASGGGQQGPVLSAAGARVTVFDNSPAQLGCDRRVAEREGLSLRTVEGDMADLACFPDSSFDLVFHPVSNLFVPNVRPVWREAFRVLRAGGVMLAGFLNPALYIFDLDRADQGELVVTNALPYADPEHLAPERRVQFEREKLPFEFSHSLTDQIGGQIDAGFVLTAIYEDRHQDFAPARYFPTYIATRAVKPAAHERPT